MQPSGLVGDALVDLFIMVLVAGVMLLAVGFALAAMDLEPASILTSGWGIAALFLGTQIPLLYLGLRRRRRNRQKQRPELPLFEGTNARAVLRGAATGAALAIFSGLYTGLVSWALGPGSVDNQIDFLKNIVDDPAAVALLVVIIAVLAPVCEETFFRGAIYATGRAVGLEKQGMVISAVLFAALHLIPLLFPFYVLFGVVMCKLYARTGTLASPIAAHVTMNAMACLSLLAQRGELV